MHADGRGIAGLARDLVFAKSVVNGVVQQHSAAVGVDGNAVGIQPDRAGSK
jgi:hypothetical protein